MTWLEKPTIAVSYLQILEEIVKEQGLTINELLDGIPIPASLMEQPGARMSPVQWALAVSRAMQLSHNQGLGYECGLRTRPSAHGFLGYAIMSCSSFREVIELASRFFEARQRDFTMRVSTDGEFGTIEVREKHQIPALRSFFYEHLLISIARGAAAVLGMEPKQFEGLELWFDWPEPSYHTEYEDKLPPICFSKPANLLKFPIHMLEMRPVMADPQASRQAVELCERELVQVGGEDDSISLRVCAELVLSDGYPNQTEVAERLHMSSRTLARKLQEDGSTFQQLLDEARRRDACKLIENSPLSLAEISTQLGYTNPANFTRAFRKWTDQSPSQYRSSLLADQ